MSHFTIAGIANTIYQISQKGAAAPIPGLSGRTQMVASLALRYFVVMRVAFVGLLGVVDVTLNGLSARARILRERERHNQLEKGGLPPDKLDAHHQHDEKLHQALRKTESIILRGSLYLGSFIFGTIVAADTLRHKEMSASYAVMNAQAKAFFLFACVITLQHSLNQYQAAKEAMGRATTSAQLACAKQNRQSAMLGVSNSIGYIFSAGLNLLGIANTLALFLGCVASFTTVLKVIQDFQAWRLEES